MMRTSLRRSPALMGVVLGVLLLAGRLHGATATIVATDNSATEAVIDTAVLTVTLSSAPTSSVTVRYTVGGTATAGTDYDTLSGSVVIAAGQTTGTITVITKDDLDVEGDESVVVTLDTGSGYTVGSPASATVYISDNEVPSAVVTATDNTAVEPTLETGTFNVILSEAPASNLTVSYTVSGTATAGTDYNALAGTLTIAAGQTTGTITVRPLSDSSYEGDETVIVTLSPGTVYSVGETRADTVTITDNPYATIAATDSAAAELGPDTGTFTVTLSVAAPSDITVNYAVAGTAEAGSDYVALSRAVTVKEGDTTATFTVTPIDDDLVEGSETVDVTLKRGTGYSLGTTLEATVNISSDDVPTVSITATDRTADEPTKGTGAFTITVSETPPTGFYVRYQIAVGGDAATLDVDYTVSSDDSNVGDGGVLTVGWEYCNTTAEVISINPQADEIIEGDETVTFTLLAGSGYSIGEPNTDTVTILGEVPTATLSAIDDEAGEEGPDTGTMTVNLTWAPEAPVFVNYTMSGTATDGTDYTAQAGTVEIAAGHTVGTITVAPIDDSTTESHETATATLQAGTGYAVGTSSTSDTVTIIDNDVPTATIAATDSAAAEAGSETGYFTVSLSSAPSADLAVSYTIAGTATNGTDYGTLTGSVTIAAGQTTGYITVVPVDDSTLETSETVEVTLTTATGYRLGSPSSATATIVNDDLPTVTVTATDSAAAEAGLATGTFTVALSAAFPADLTVVYGVTGTAASGTDYTALGTALTVAAGATSGTLTVTPLADSSAEGDETIIVTLSAGTNYTVGSPSSATVTLADDDVPTATIATTSNPTEAGPQSGTLTVSLSSVVPSGLTVGYTVSGTATSGTDYTALGGTVSVPAGQSSTTITITPLDDSLVEGDETVIVTLNTSTGYSIGTPGSATAMIGDDEVTTATLAATDSSAAESGADTGTFTITLASAATADTTVNYTVSGTATSGSDYTALSGSATILSGQTSTTITVTPIDDTEVEADESVTVTLAPGTGYSAGTQYSDTVTIDSEDVPAVTIAPTDSEAAEASLDSGFFTLTLDSASPEALVVNYTLTGSATAGSDYATLAGTVDIPAGQTSGTITVTPIDDMEVEDTEAVVVTLASGTGYTVGGDASGAVLIADDDIPTVTVSPTDRDVGETGLNSGTFRVTLSSPPVSSMTVWFTLEGTASSTDDYTAVPSAGVTLDPGQTSGTIKVTPKEDELAEGDETITVVLSSSAHYNLGTPNRATVTLSDNDVPNATATSLDSSASETGPDTATFVVSLEYAPTADVTVNYTVSGTATSGSDYIALPGTLTVAAGSTEGSVTMTPIDDSLPEDDETVIFTLATGSGYSLGATTSTTAVIADDDEPAASITATDSAAAEAGSNTGTFTITLSTTPQRQTVILYSVGGTASNGSDYTSLPGSVTLAAGQASGTLTVTPVDDSEEEGSETVIVTLLAGTGYSLGSPYSTTVTISDDDKTYTIAGQVTRSGTAVPNAWVDLFSEAGSWLANTQTNASGTYSFMSLDPGSYTVRAYDPDNGNAPTEYGSTITITTTDISSVNIDFNTAYSVSGTVTQGSTAASGVWLDLFTEGGVWKCNAQTDSSGAYTLGPAPVGTYNVYAYDPVTFAQTAYGSNPVSLTRDLADIDIALPAVYSLSGRVTSGGLAVSGAWVDLFTDGGAWRQNTQTDANGNYSFSGVSAGSYTVRGYDPWSDNAPTEYGSTVTVSSSDRIGIDIAFVRSSYAITGTVKQVGSAASGVWVDLYDTSGTWVAHAQSGSDGTYTLGPIASGTYNVYAYEPGPMTQTAYSGNPITLADNATGVDFNFASGGSIAGTVTSGGTVVSGAWVDLWTEAGTWVKNTQTDANGAYRFDGLTNGNYTVRAYDPANNNAPADYGSTITLAGTVKTGINIAFTATYSLSGTVSSRGTPVVSAWVDLFTAGGTWVQNVQTGSDGGYAFTGVATGNYLVRAYDPNNSNAPTDYETLVALTSGDLSNINIDFNP